MAGNKKTPVNLPISVNYNPINPGLSTVFDKLQINPSLQNFEEFGLRLFLHLGTVHQCMYVPVLRIRILFNPDPDPGKKPKNF